MRRALFALVVALLAMLPPHVVRARMAYTTQGHDTFTGTVTDDLTSGHTPEQGTWTQRNCTWQIGSSNHGGPTTADAGNGCVCELNVTLADKQQAISVFGGINASGSSLVRFTWTGSNTWTAYRTMIYLGTIYLIRDDVGVGTGSVLQSAAYPGGNSSTVTTTADGSSLAVDVDGTPNVLTATDATYTSGRVAMYSYPGGSADTWDEMTIKDDAGTAAPLAPSRRNSPIPCCTPLSGWLQQFMGAR